MRPFLRVVGAGVVTAAVVGVTGWAIERARFGPTDDTALARVAGELRQHLDTTADTLGAIAARVASAGAVIRAASRDQAAHKSLFDAVDAALTDEDAGRIGITVYGPAGAPLAWGSEAHVRELLGDAFELAVEERTSIHREPSGKAYWDYMVSGFGPLKTLDASLDEDGREQLSQAWVDFTETMRENDEIVHRREYLLIVGTRR